MMDHMPWLLTGLAVLVTWVQIRLVSVGLAEAKKEISRYELYAARDRLVYLVAAGRIDENDEAWQVAYDAANNLLSIHERLDLRSVLNRMARFRKAAERDHAVRRRKELAERALRRASRDVEGFEDAMVALDHGFWSAMTRQTHWFDLLWFHLQYRARQAMKSTSETPGELPAFANDMCAA
jgi:hypothetical protein